MKYYILKGFTDSTKRYVPILDAVKNCEIIESTFDMILNPPKVEANSTLIGFSLGALIAFRISQQQPIHKLIACSMSPFLADDIDSIPLYLQKRWLPKAVKYKKLNYNNSLAKKSYFLCGSKEPEQLKKRTIAMHGKTIPGIEHELSKKYVKHILGLLP